MDPPVQISSAEQDLVLDLLDQERRGLLSAIIRAQKSLEHHELVTRMTQVDALISRLKLARQNATAKTSSPTGRPQFILTRWFKWLISKPDSDSAKISDPPIDSLDELTICNRTAE